MSCPPPCSSPLSLLFSTLLGLPLNFIGEGTEKLKADIGRSPTKHAKAPLKRGSSQTLVAVVVHPVPEGEGTSLTPLTVGRRLPQRGPRGVGPEWETPEWCPPPVVHLQTEASRQRGSLIGVSIQNGEVHVSHQDVHGHIPLSCLSTHSSIGTLNGRTSQQPCARACCTMVATGIQWTATSAETKREREWEAKTAKEGHTEILVKS